MVFISDGVGGKTEQGNHEGVDSLPSQELKKLVNGNSKVRYTLHDAAFIYSLFIWYYLTMLFITVNADSWYIR